MYSFLSIVIKKIVKNRWLVLSQFFGVLIVTSLLSSIPAFSNGIMQQILTDELSSYQVKYNEFPGKIGMSINSQILDDEVTDVKVDFARELLGRIPELFKMPEISRHVGVTTEYLKMIIPSRTALFEEKQNIYLSAIKDIDKHIDIYDGRLYVAESVPSAPDGKTRVYEAIVSEQALGFYELSIGREYVIEDAWEVQSDFILRIVGVFKIKKENDPFWSSDIEKGRREIYIDYDLYDSEFVKTHKFRYCKFKFDYYFDYTELMIQNVKTLLDAQDKIDNTFMTSKNALEYDFPIKDIIKEYYEKVGKINIIMLSTNIPLLFMLALFIIMIAFIKINKERNDISVAASRGASRFQITAAYFTESLLIALTAFAAGPLCGMLIARFIGVSKGFMEFVNRTGLKTPMIPDMFFYSLAGALSSLILTTVAAYFSSSMTVVMHKQSLGRSLRKPIWQRVFLDIILLGASGYGLHIFNQRQDVLAKTALSTESLGINPLLFIIPALFMVALGMMFLRIYPVFVELIFIIGKRFWPPGIYASLLQTCRTITQYGFISLFIMFTIALGIYNANTARTIKSNAEDRIRYSIGTDISIKPFWVKWAKKVPLPNSSATMAYSYLVPDFTKFASLDSVDTATKVYITDDCTIFTRNGNDNSRLMAITAHEFGKVSWFREDLLPYHWYEYLNLITKKPSAILISRSLAEEHALKPGDLVKIAWTRYGYAVVNFILYAVIDYWPSWNPIPAKDPKFKDTSTGDKDKPKLVVANFRYISDKMGMIIEPWDIWMKLKPGATTEDLYEDIKEVKLKITSLENVDARLQEFSMDPFQTSLNGTMTVSFCTALLICLTGFILFWVRSIRSREFQYGLFRAIGLKQGSVRNMLALEQLLVSGVSVFMGIVIGMVATRIFIKFFGLAYSPYEQVPPFRTVIETQDFLRLIYFISVMFLIGLGILNVLVSRIKTAQALKLGED